MQSHAAPYYIHAPHSLDKGLLPMAQLHALCHQLNTAGQRAFLVDAPKVHGGWWTPLLTPQIMASHCEDGAVPISIAIDNDEEQMRPGLKIRFQPAIQAQDAHDLYARLHFSQPGALAGSTQDFALKAALPWFDSALLQLPLATQRSGALVYSGELLSGQCKIKPEHAALRDISPFAEQPMATRERWRLLSQAQCLYAYAGGTVVTEARLLGCKVVYVANDHQLQALPEHPMETWGVSLNTADAPLHERPFSTKDFRNALHALQQEAPPTLHRLIAATQSAAGVLPSEKAWNVRQLYALDALLPTTADERSARADALATEKLCQAYATWKAKATPTEVYSDVCAELVGSGQVQSPVVHLFGHGRTQAALADTMDDLGKSWLSPTRIVIHADVATPVPADELGNDLQWVGPNNSWSTEQDTHNDWVILLEAGTRLEPYALIELLATARHVPSAHILYAAYDLQLVDGKRLPHLPGGTNPQWLRSTNYLGSLVAVRPQDWHALPDCGRFVSVYRLALRSSAQHGAASVHYVDKILSHAPTQLASGQEEAEFLVAQQELKALYPGSQLISSPQLGCWNVEYPDPGTALSLIVPTGKQQGYLRSLLLSCIRLYPGQLQEALLLVQDEDIPTMQQFVAHWPHGEALPLRLVATGAGAYSHARSLNLGLAAAHTELVLVCDDDIEWLDSNALPQLRRLFSQEDLAVAAPRLVQQQGKSPLVLAGPHIAGEGAQLINYTGLGQGLAERGYFNRLQMAQDVAGVHGSCWMARRSAILAAGGLDEEHTPLMHAVTDLGYRLQQAGWRLNWTPMASALHAGGMTIKALRQDPVQALRLSQACVDEARYLQTRWITFIGQHRLYSRHLSGAQAYRLDTGLINHWSNEYRARSTVLASPLSSGSGQYRVIEPLDALQFRSMAETCVISPAPSNRKARRILTALDIARCRPQRILVQHSITDQDIANLRSIRLSHPDAFIVQLMDDLTSDLPASHPNHVYGQREGHVRTLQALELSNRLIVSTQPLADYYKPYCKDVRLVPNALDPQYWGQLQRTAPSRTRLRVGWAGAAQHLGDLRLVANVVQAVANEVDWIFMGMCPDELRPYIKEFHRFVSYKDYPAKLASLDLDIAIAPLEDNPFNACKSNLRLLEYGAMGWPVVCSDVYPFRTDNPPVLRVPNNEAAWLQALRGLMTNAELRRTQGAALHAWQQENYRLEKHVDAWFQAVFA